MWKVEKLNIIKWFWAWSPDKLHGSDRLSTEADFERSWINREIQGYYCLRYFLCYS